MSSPETIPPPLPPPLPTHSRSLSYSSSSSSAGSPAQQSGPFASNTVRRTASKSGNALSRSSSSRALGGGTRAGGGSGSSVSSSSPPLSRSSSFVRRTADSPASQRSPATARRSASASNSPDPSAPTSRHRASSLLTKVSPSLSQSRYASSNTSSVGLGSNNTINGNGKARREPLGLGLGIGVGGFSRGLGQLPSPPHTASDGASTASNTIRSRDGLDSEHGSGGSAEHRPERPPRSEARTSLSTPPKNRTLPFDIPAIERSSPTVKGSPARTGSPNGDARSTSSHLVDSNVRSSSSKLATRKQPSGFDDPASPNSPSPGSPRAASSLLHSSTGSESDASAKTAKGDEAGKGKGRVREGSAEASDTLEQRRERRNRRTSELQAANQKALDTVNSSTDSPPAARNNAHDATSLTHHASSSTLRSPSVEGIVASPTTFSHRRDWSHDKATADRRSSLERTLRSSASVDEFGASQDVGSMRRSSTMSALGGEEESGATEAGRRVRTVGAGSASRRGGADDLPERSYTSMSTYSPGGGFPRRSELVGSERTRAVSSFGDNADRDRNIAAGMRRMASRDALSGIGLGSTSPRVRRRASEAGLLLDQAQKTELPDSPAVASSSNSPSVRQRPGLPSEFLQSPSTSSPSLGARRSPRPDLDLSSSRTNSPRISSPLLRDRINSPQVHSPRTASPLSTPDPDRLSAAERRRQSQSEGVTTYAGRGESADFDAVGLPHPRPPRAGRAAKGSGGSGSTGSGGGITSPGRAQWREGAISEEEGSGPRAASRLDERSRSRAEEREDVFRNGLEQLGSPEHRDSRYSSIAADLETRKEKLRSAEVGSAAWMAELQDLRRRSARSRASGSSGDARSTVDVPPSPAGHIERDRTVRALNALYNGDGTPLSPSSSSNNSSPRKRDSGQFGSQRSRRISFADSSHESPSSAMVRSTSASTSRSGAGSRMGGHRSSSDHHHLLYAAFDRFEQYFSTSDGQETISPESADLVKRMLALVGSTAKLNSGLRTLVTATTEAQVEAELDEATRLPTVGIAQFEKSINSLLRTSDDQVRSLTEDLIAFTRVERERDRLRQSGESFSRPASRASNYRGGALHASPKRPATSSPFEGASVSTSGGGRGVPSSASRQTLRDPMAEEDREPRRHTMSVSSSRGQYAAADSPTPGSRREAAQLRSPLSALDGFATARRSSISSLASSSAPDAQMTPSRSELGLPSATTGRVSLRRAKGSSTSTTTVRPVTPTHRFPTTSTSPDAPVVDSTPALPFNSPTRDRVLPTSTSIPFPSATSTDRYRTYSHASASSHTGSLSPELGRPAKERSSTGSSGAGLGAALRSLAGLKSRRGVSEQEDVRGSMEGEREVEVVRRGSLDSSRASSSPEERRAERRREVEAILRRSSKGSK